MIKTLEVSTSDIDKDSESIMPLSFDEVTRRYENYALNIQDLIYTLESFMGSTTSFTFDMPKALGNLDEVDTMKEERNISLYIQSLEEYKKIIIAERKRRSLAEIIHGKIKVDQLKTNLKNRRRSRRVSFNNPYQQKSRYGIPEGETLVEVMKL